MNFGVPEIIGAPKIFLIFEKNFYFAPLFVVKL